MPLQSFQNFWVVFEIKFLDKRASRGEVNL